FGNMNWSSEIEGVNEDSLITGNWLIEEGREISAREIASGAKVAVIGETVRKELFGAADPIGQTIRVNKIPVRIVGTLKPKGENSWGRDQDDLIMMPIKAVQNRLVPSSNRSNPKSIRQIMIKVHDNAIMSQ